MFHCVYGQMSEIKKLLLYYYYYYNETYFEMSLKIFKNIDNSCK